MFNNYFNHACFIKLFSKQLVRNGHKKALIITSREHATMFDVNCKGVRIKHQGAYLKEHYKNNIKFLAFNWYKWIPPGWYTELLPHKTNGLSAQGKWDAAFEMNNCKAVGFDFGDSPFGLEHYDYSYDNELKWSDAFDGYVYYEPFYNFTCKKGFPAPLNNKQAKQIAQMEYIYAKAYGNKKNARLIKLFGWIYKYSIKTQYSEMHTFKIAPGNLTYQDLMNEMNKWLE